MIMSRDHAPALPLRLPFKACNNQFYVAGNILAPILPMKKFKLRGDKNNDQCQLVVTGMKRLSS